MAILESVAAWVAQVLRPLAYALGSDDDDLVQFVAGLGWELPVVPPVLRATHADLAVVHDRLLELQDVRRQVAAGEAPGSRPPTRSSTSCSSRCWRLPRICT